MAVSSTRFRNRPEPASCARGASLCAAVAPVEALVEALVEASAPVGAAVPWGYVPPFGTTSCLYEGPWHIHVPLGTYPHGTASFVNVQVMAPIVEADTYDAAPPPSSLWRSSLFRESKIEPDSRVPRRAAGESKRCPERAEGRCSAALGVERHMDVPRSRTEAGRRRERRPPVRQNGGPLRSRRTITLLEQTPAPSKPTHHNAPGDAPSEAFGTRSRPTRPALPRRRHATPAAPAAPPRPAHRRCAGPD